MKQEPLKQVIEVEVERMQVDQSSEKEPRMAPLQAECFAIAGTYGFLQSSSILRAKVELIFLLSQIH